MSKILYVEVDNDIKQGLKKYAVDNDCTLKEIVTDAVKDYILKKNIIY